MLRSLLVLAGCLVTALPALAYSDACDENVKRFCADVVPGNSRLTQCMISNLSRLSPACAVEYQGIIEKRGPFKQHCAADAQSICPRIKPGIGRLYSCLKFNEGSLSQNCRKYLAASDTP